MSTNVFDSEGKESDSTNSTSLIVVIIASAVSLTGAIFAVFCYRKNNPQRKVNQQRSVENEIEMNEIKEKEEVMVKDSTQTNEIERVVVNDSDGNKQANNETEWYFHV